MGRRKHVWHSNFYGIFIIGEQIRLQMQQQGLIRDRRYHLRKFKNCFVARDAIDWLLKMYHVQSRVEAVRAMQILLQNGMIHHVVDDHEFKDQNLFYRFTFDDDTYKLNKDLVSLYRGVIYYRKMKSESEVLRDFYHKGVLYSEAFYGNDAVDFIVATNGNGDRGPVVADFRDLLERNIIKHVTDDYHFSDDRLIYEFSLDFNRPCLLHDVLDMASDHKNSTTTTSSSGVEDVEERNSNPDLESLPVDMSSSLTISPAQRPSIDSAMSGLSSSPESNAADGDSFASLGQEPKSVLVRPVTVKELENTSSPYVKKTFKIQCDEMGFGFVLRGSSPCYVQTVDPLGPAAVAGMKVRQFISTVNGQNVLRMDHRQVGQLIAQQTQINVTVLVYRSDAQRM
ncbi:DEP domain-containing mTOR-interacting protein-like isoform X1 [Biomphalaria glabrata]|uniref:DEP domain-containing mTOR-interacting protein-like isoform X1 n=1 Tax=Biomphalaria glabrata TaxID=6526 RepID=A0A9U8DTX9_BIOGL|nr:DEP domain-containing mTOR-interacting protein-like isoform X1 [Biomphalaria glabrata]KAI8749754.1 DEP domain-containing mTOR-interacting protein-like isoform X1 [Biomphalaria glabrata]